MYSNLCFYVNYGIIIVYIFIFARESLRLMSIHKEDFFMENSIKVTLKGLSASPATAPEEYQEPTSENANSEANTTAAPTAPTSFYHKLKTKLFARTTSAANTKFKLICRKISKFFVSCIIFYILGILFPELREKLPAMYEFLDLALDFLNWCYEVLLELLRWCISILSFGKITF